MSTMITTRSESNTIEEQDSLDNYKDYLLKYIDRVPSLTEALMQLLISSRISLDDEHKQIIKDIYSKVNSHLNKKFNEIKDKYKESKISIEDAIIISSYTCQLSNNDGNYNISEILNNNLVSKYREEGIKNVSKYLFLLLKSLRKLPKYKLEQNKFLYRSIGLNLNLDLTVNNIIPYIKGNINIFGGFTSTSTYPRFTYNDLGMKKDIKKGAILIINGKDIFGYDISLFNIYGEEEILLEPERKFEIEDSNQFLKEIICLKCKIKETPIIFKEICEVNEITIKYKIRNEKEIKIFGSAFVNRYKNYCKIIYEENELELQEIFNVTNRKKKY